VVAGPLSQAEAEHILSQGALAPDITPVQQDVLMEAYRNEMVRIGKRTKTEMADLADTFGAAMGDDEARVDLIKEEIDKLRDEQRTYMFEQAKLVSRVDIQEMIKHFDDGDAGFSTCTDEDKGSRRSELLAAVKGMMGPKWTIGPAQEAQMCAFEFIIAARGMDDYQKFAAAAPLREAARSLFADPSTTNLCNATDGAVLCTGHEGLRKAKMFMPYLSVEQFADPFIETFPESKKRGPMTASQKAFYQRVFEKRALGSDIGDSPELPHAFAQYGDVHGRIVRGQLVRLLEEFLKEDTRVDWYEVMSEFGEDVCPTGTDGDQSGAVLMEYYDGELACELECMLWRARNGDRVDGREAVKPRNRMPDLPAYRSPLMGDMVLETFEKLFPVDEELDDRQKGRQYIRRLVYTSLQCSWFLHSPSHPAMIATLERAANNPDGSFLQRAIERSTTRVKLDTDDFKIIATLRGAILNEEDGTGRAMHENLRARVAAARGELAIDIPDDGSVKPENFTTYDRFQWLVSKGLLGCKLIKRCWRLFVGILGAVIVIGGVCYFYPPAGQVFVKAGDQALRAGAHVAGDLLQNRIDKADEARWEVVQGIFGAAQQKPVGVFEWMWGSTKSVAIGCWNNIMYGIITAGGIILFRKALSIIGPKLCPPERATPKPAARRQRQTRLGVVEPLDGDMDGIVEDDPEIEFGTMDPAPLRSTSTPGVPGPFPPVPFSPAPTTPTPGDIEIAKDEAIATTMEKINTTLLLDDIADAIQTQYNPHEVSRASIASDAANFVLLAQVQNAQETRGAEDELETAVTEPPAAEIALIMSRDTNVRSAALKRIAPKAWSRSVTKKVHHTRSVTAAANTARKRVKTGSSALVRGGTLDIVAPINSMRVSDW
jgi:hypothetical protein